MDKCEKCGDPTPKEELDEVNQQIGMRICNICAEDLVWRVRSDEAHYFYSCGEK